MSAHELKGGEWDVIVDEPMGSVPELEALRVDGDKTILIGHANSEAEARDIFDDIEKQLWGEYRLVPFYQEPGRERQIQRIVSHLKQCGAQGWKVGSGVLSAAEMQRKVSQLLERMTRPGGPGDRDHTFDSHDGTRELLVRKKDFDLAREVAEPNFPEAN